MKRLILIRHAHAGWDDPLVQDHERPLSYHGKKSADALGKWVAAEGHTPDQVLCSTATRCRETCDRVLQKTFPKPPVEFNRKIYHVWADEMRWVLMKSQGDTVMILGHNPGISALAEGLLKGKKPKHPEFLNYLPAATTIIDFDISEWEAHLMGSGMCMEFFVPTAQP